MLFFVRNANVKRAGANFALAIALMAGSAVTVTAFADTAHAKKRDRDAEKAPKADYSKEFIAAYNPINALSSGEDANPSAAAARIPELVASIKTADDRSAAGGYILGLGRTLKDQQLELQGIDLMFESGKHPAPGQLHWTRYQIYLDQDQFAKARTSLQSAVDVGYSFDAKMSDGSTQQFTTADLEALVADIYFREEDFGGGFAYLEGLLERTIEAGERPKEAWIKTGFGVANRNSIADKEFEFSVYHVKFYPSPLSWGNALAIQRNNYDLDDNLSLDVMRLANRTGAMRNSRDYVDYIDSATKRGLPAEVKMIVDQGIAAGELEANDVMVSEARTLANSGIARDKTDLPELEASARKANSTASTATAAGDVFLSYGTAAKAEEMYKIAVSRPGADLGRVYMRLGIAQIDQGKVEDAKASFAMVTAERARIAELWSLYADTKMPDVAEPIMEEAADPVM